MNIWKFTHLNAPTLMQWVLFSFFDYVQWEFYTRSHVRVSLINPVTARCPVAVHISADQRIDSTVIQNCNESSLHQTNPNLNALDGSLQSSVPMQCLTCVKMSKSHKQRKPSRVPAVLILPWQLLTGNLSPFVISEQWGSNNELCT